MTTDSFTCSDFTGTFRFDNDAMPSIDDMNTILGCVATDETDFMRLCEISTTWPDSLTCEQFHAKALAS